MKKIVGVSLRVVEATGCQEPRDEISHDWIRFLSGYDITPVLIPNKLPDVTEFVRDLKLSALFLSNGNNISPLNDEEERLDIDDVSIDRDKTERELISFAVSNRIPLIGICRGMQMLNVYFGGRMVRDLSEVCGMSKPHVAKTHEIQFVDADMKRQWQFNNMITNSFHNQGITTDTLSWQLKPFAMADHGIVEGVYHPDLPIAGIQWHPERAGSSVEVDSVLFKAFVNQELYWRKR